MQAIFAHAGFFLFDALQAFIGVNAADLSLALAFAVSDDDVLVGTHLAANDTADSDFTDIVVVVEGRYHELERAFEVALGAGQYLMIVLNKGSSCRFLHP